MTTQPEEHTNTAVLDTNQTTDTRTQGGDHAGRPTVLNISQNYFVRGGSDRYFFVISDLLEKHGHRVIPFAAKQSQDDATEWAKYFPQGINFQSPKPMDLARFIYSPRAAKAMDR